MSEVFHPVEAFGRLTVADKLTIEDHFDVWAKCWNADTDTFSWSRFTDCQWRWGDTISAGRKPRIVGVGDGYRPVYWVEIPKPPEAADPI